MWHNGAVLGFTVATFTPHLDEPFRVEGAPGLVAELVLSEVTDLSTRYGTAPQGRPPFSLLFQGDPALLLPQGIYHLEHDTLGAFDLFLVPLGPEGGHMRYEAVFG